MIQALLSRSRASLIERLMGGSKGVEDRESRRSKPAVFSEPAAASDSRLPGAVALPRSFKKGFSMLRSALVSEGLRVPMEIDATRIIYRELGLDLPPCKVLFVCTPQSLLEAVVVGPPLAAYIPAHLIITGHRDLTVVALQSPPESELPTEVRDPVRKLHARIARAVEKARLGGGE